MEISGTLLLELQKRLKVGSRRGVHLNAIAGRSRYKFDINRLSQAEVDLPQSFVNSVLSNKPPMTFKIRLGDNLYDDSSEGEKRRQHLLQTGKSLENLVNQTNAIESEKGINTFGFGFPLLVRRDQSDHKLTVAPILIWSLHIRRTKDYNTWEIFRNDDDPIYINEILINHLLSDAQIKIDQLPSEYLDDGYIDKDELVDICVNIMTTIEGAEDEDWHSVFKQQIEEVHSVGDKKHYEKQLSEAQRSYIDFAGLFSIFEVQKQNIINDYDRILQDNELCLDMETSFENYFQPISAIETDPTQQSVLHALRSSRHILIQGPPGTGKSQTLTAILINALESYKKTMVVCEKRTALEVLYKALQEKGVGDRAVLIKDAVKDRRSVVNEVRDRVDNVPFRAKPFDYTKNFILPATKRAANMINVINKRHKKIGTKLFNDNDWTNTVGLLLSEQNKIEEDCNLDLNVSMFSFEPTELEALIETIETAQDLYNDMKPFLALSFLDTKKMQGNNSYKLEQQIQESYVSYQKQMESIQASIEAYEKWYYASRHEQLEKELASTTESKQLLANILDQYDRQSVFYNEKKTKGIFYALQAMFTKAKQDMLKSQKQAYALYARVLRTTQASQYLPSMGRANNLVEIKQHLEAYAEKEKQVKDTFQHTIETAFSQINFLKRKTLVSFDNTTELNNIASCIDSLLRLIKKEAWSTHAFDLTSHLTFFDSLRVLLDKKEAYFNYHKDVFTKEFNWSSYYNNLTYTKRSLVDSLLTKNDWKTVFAVYYLNTMLIEASNKSLLTHEKDHQALVRQMGVVAKKQILQIQHYWVYKQYDEAINFEKSNKNFKVGNLFLKNSGSKRRKLSLREITSIGKDLFTSFFPVILCTPDVASNLFMGQEKYFDIVMFDEASQLKLEDNLPAMLKGKQIVIAGDEHQMPPSNYFSKTFDVPLNNEDEYADDSEEYRIKMKMGDMILDCESLLDFASNLGFEQHHLDFHYRSRHPFLIDFSNHAFYNLRLKPLPNTLDYTPIKYIDVNGVYNKNMNVQEADAVLAIIDKNISLLPNGQYPSVGVATFNIIQRNLILSKINERRNDERYSDFNNKMRALEANGFFVKNLENIQGDERDVIILSTTYGVNTRGKFVQRFGSINHQKGYKLLNVIITRAKYKVYVCSSIPQEVFLDYKTQLEEEGSNNRRAALYAYLAYAKAVSEQDMEAKSAVLNTLYNNAVEKASRASEALSKDNTFVNAVEQLLRAHFEADTIVPQMRFAGFVIDLAYVSKNPNVPTIAIECDGTDMHSSQEAYLYDVHRKKILEQHGFVFHRIWSTKWWRNAKAEAQELVQLIQEVEDKYSTAIKQPNENDDIPKAFTDDDLPEGIIDMAPYDEEAQVSKVDNTDATAEKTAAKAPARRPKKKAKIAINKIVTIKYLNTNQDVTIRLVDKKISSSAMLAGVSDVDIHSTFGKALMGKTIGDNVQAGGLDKYVCILNIE